MRTEKGKTNGFCWINSSRGLHVSRSRLTSPTNYQNNIVLLRQTQLSLNNK